MSISLDFSELAWGFVAAIAIHNFEEAMLLPHWSQTAGKWHAPVGAFEFRFAVIFLTGLGAVLAWLAVARNGAGVYLLCGYALAMALNVAVPHVAGSLALRRYVPGTATAVLLNLPVCSAVLLAAAREHLIAWPTFAWAGPLVVGGILALIPILFRAGRALAPLLHPTDLADGPPPGGGNCGSDNEAQHS